MSSLGDLVTIIMGQSPPGDRCNSSGIGLPLLNGPTEFGPHHPTAVQFTTDGRKQADEGDLLFCVRGSTTGRMNWADQRYAIGRGVAAIRHVAGKDYQPYLRGVIEANLQHLLATVTGSTFPNLSRDQLLSLPVTVPPLPEQKRIAHILGTLDDKIELNRRMCKTLEEMARALFKSWFVDFDPVRAKAEGRQPFGMDAATTALFPDSFVDSELGPIPRGWEVKALGDVAELRRDTVDPRKAPETEYRHFSIPSFDNGQKAVVEAGSGIQSNKYVIPGHGAVLISKLNPGIPRVWLVVAPGENAVCSTEFLVSVPGPSWSSAHLYGQLTEEGFQAAFAARARGTTGSHQRVTPADFLTMPVVVPPCGVAALFTSAAEPQLALTERCRGQNAALAAARDVLLPRLLSGVGHVDSMDAVGGQAGRADA